MLFFQRRPYGSASYAQLSQGTSRPSLDPNLRGSRKRRICNSTSSSAKGGREACWYCPEPIGRSAQGLRREKAQPHCDRQPLSLQAGAGSKRCSLCALIPALLDNGAQKKKGGGGAGILGSNEESQSFKEVAKRIRPLVSLNTSLPPQTLCDFCDSRMVSAFL